VADGREEATMKVLFGVYLIGILAGISYFAVIGLTHH
jgi:hypothetical protein